jgi:hypothetical protein
MGQSIIEYGQGVGRAGAAGAASGTGIAGIFSKVKNTSDDDQTKKRPASRTVTSQEEAEANELVRSPNEAANAPLKMRTSSGVVVSGVSPGWMAASHREPLREPVRVRTIEWSNPAEENPGTGEQQGVTDAAGESSPAAPPALSVEPTAEAAEPARVVSPGHSFGESSSSSGPDSTRLGSAFSDPPQLEPVTDAEVAGVRIGSRIDDVLQTLGRPTFTLTGITGKSYTEKYVFKNADGETITVLTWAGVVTSVLVS